MEKISNRNFGFSHKRLIISSILAALTINNTVRANDPPTVIGGKLPLDEEISNCFSCAEKNDGKNHFCT